jgi:hypothetical protein
MLFFILGIISSQGVVFWQFWNIFFIKVVSILLQSISIGGSSVQSITAFKGGRECGKTSCNYLVFSQELI